MKIRIVEKVIDIRKNIFDRKIKNVQSDVSNAFITEQRIEEYVANMMHNLAEKVRRYRYQGPYPMMFGIYTTPPIVTISFTAPSYAEKGPYASLDVEEQAAVDFIADNKVTLMKQLDEVEAEMSKIEAVAQSCPAGRKYAFDQVNGEDRHCIPNVEATRRIIANSIEIYKNK